MTSTDRLVPRVGRPRSFSDDELVTCALGMGPENLNLRAMAEALGVPRSTVYNRVASVDALGSLVLSTLLERVLGLGWEMPDAGWQTSLQSLAVFFREALLGAGGWIRFYNPAVHIDARSLGQVQAVMGRMVEAGFEPGDAGRAVGLVMALVRDAAVMRAAVLFRKIKPATAATSPQETLDPIVARFVTTDPADEDMQFHYNLDRVIDGINVSLTLHKES